MAAFSDELIARLRTIVGRRHVLVKGVTTTYATGYRVGGGAAAAVVRPGSLVQLWRVFVACVAADHIVIAQAANTGLTGGSTPMGDYDRPVVIVSTLRTHGVVPILGGKQVICLAGATLYDLEHAPAPLGREPHSVIGSSCLGASVVGEVCNNSGGALVQRGPAYTEYALYAQVDENGTARLVNHLGVAFGGDPEDILRALDEGRIPAGAITEDGRAASAAADYAQVVREIDEPSAGRFNADPKRLHEASGSAGKVLVLAVRLDTFPVPKQSTVFYVGTNDTAELTALRRALLSGNGPLPVSGEYIHREAFDIAALRQGHCAGDPLARHRPPAAAVSHEGMGRPARRQAAVFAEGVVRTIATRRLARVSAAPAAAAAHVSRRLRAPAEGALERDCWRRSL